MKYGACEDGCMREGLCAALATERAAREQAESERDTALARAKELERSKSQGWHEMHSRAGAAETALASARELLAQWLGWRRGKVGREPLTTNTRTWLTSHPAPVEAPCEHDSVKAPMLSDRELAAARAALVSARPLICRLAMQLRHTENGELLREVDSWLTSHPAPVAARDPHGVTLYAGKAAPVEAPCAGCAAAAERIVELELSLSLAEDAAAYGEDL